MTGIQQVETPEQYETAALLFREYADWLGIDLGFQKFNDELVSLQQMYSRPRGIIYLAMEGETICGCIAVRDKGSSVAELKRMFVRKNFEGKGFGTQLLLAALLFAKNAGYEKIRLDTLDTMKNAIHLYTSAGFRQIDPYYFNPEKNALFFEKELR